jgi:hypothetical protein
MRARSLAMRSGGAFGFGDVFALPAKSLLVLRALRYPRGFATVDKRPPPDHLPTGVESCRHGDATPDLAPDRAIRILRASRAKLDCGLGKCRSKLLSAWGLALQCALLDVDDQHVARPRISPPARAASRSVTASSNVIRS